jgi:hypothetical protein
LKRNIALKLERTSGEFTLGVKREQFIYFWENYEDVMKRLKEENTPEDVLYLFQLKHDLCEACVKLYGALDRVKSFDKLNLE